MGRQLEQEVARLTGARHAVAVGNGTDALIILLLIPLALRGVRYRPSSATDLLRRNLLIYGAGGLIAPFIGIKLLDLGISLIPGL